MREILTRLAFEVRDARDTRKTGDDLGFEVGVPSFRATKDVAIEDDLIEVGRMYRYDNIAEQPLRSVVAVPAREPELWLCPARSGISPPPELGSHEVYDYSFVPDAVLAACGAG